MVGIMVIELFADHVHSLKEKRQLLSSLKDRLRRRFNVAVAETGHNESWQQSQVAVASVSNSRQLLEGMFRQVEKFIDENCEMQITQVHVEFR